MIAVPLAMLIELTHRCPLACPYCSNPLALARSSDEVDTAAWRQALEEATALGVLHVHFSGGEPTLRRDLTELVQHAAGLGLYTNLITSGVFLDENRVVALAAAGLDHVQLSLQDSDPIKADTLAGCPGSHARKLAAARAIRAAGLPLTLNVVLHRHNLDRLEDLVELAISLGAARLELAHAQYYGWGLANRAALMPLPEQVLAANEFIAAARARWQGQLLLDYVAPDYYARWPKACMGGWGRQFFVITPAGRVLPCHAAESLPGLVFDRIGDRPLATIWSQGQAFQRFRGTNWMPEPCRGCDRREIDWGGCRCQAFALTGRAEAADPVCQRSSDHELVRRHQATLATAPNFRYRRNPTQS